MYGEQQEKSEHDDVVGEEGGSRKMEASIEKRAEDVLECVRTEEA